MNEEKRLSIEELLQIAAEKNASDVHIAIGSPAQFRINGRCVYLKAQPFSIEEIKYMIHFFLNDKQKKRLEETGEVTFAFSTSKNIRCRANIFLQGGYYAATFRLLGVGIPKAETLQIPQNILELYKERQGLIILSGASGSGRTTTLAVLLDWINQKIGGHILTLESPIEYLHTGKKAMIHQREIGLDTISYSNALKAAQKEDVDVLLVGEVQDADTIQAMIQAAEMGHLVFGVMDAVGAIETIEQMIEGFLPEQQMAIQKRLADVLKAVVSQQLIPVIGSAKRQSVFDLIYTNHTVKNLIRDGKIMQIKEIMQAENRMQRMEEEVFKLYIQGVIVREQALCYIKDTSLTEKMLI